MTVYRVADSGGFSPKTFMPLPLERSCIRPSFSSNNSPCLNEQINFSVEIKLYIYKRYRLINNHFLQKKNNKVRQLKLKTKA